MKISKLRKKLLVNSCEKVEVVNFHHPHQTFHDGTFGDIPDVYYECDVELLSATYDGKLQIFILGGETDANN